MDKTTKELMSDYSESLGYGRLGKSKSKTSLGEVIATIILLPIVLLFKLAVLLIVFLFLASPLILIAWIIGR
jgi:hypothetical protein